MVEGISFRLAGALAAGIALLSFARSASYAEQREIAEVAFAARARTIQADRATNTLVTPIEFAAQAARIVRLVIQRPQAGAPCIDELEVYGPNSPTWPWPVVALWPGRRLSCPGMPFIPCRTSTTASTATTIAG